MGPPEQLDGTSELAGQRREVVVELDDVCGCRAAEPALELVHAEQPSHARWPRHGPAKRTQRPSHANSRAMAVLPRRVARVEQPVGSIAKSAWILGG